MADPSNPARRPDATRRPDAGGAGIGGRLPALGANGEGWVAIQVALLGLCFAAGFLGPALAGGWRWASLAAGVIVMAGGGFLLVTGSLGLRENLTPFPRPRAGGRLVATGVYGLVRHPIYTGVVSGAVGWALVTASPAALAAAALLLAFFDLKSRREEAWLLAAYPAYAAYRRRVRKLVPFLY